VALTMTTNNHQYKNYCLLEGVLQSALLDKNRVTFLCLIHLM